MQTLIFATAVFVTATFAQRLHFPNCYICPTTTFVTATFARRLHFPNGYICPTATFVATTFALAAASGGDGAPPAPASTAAPTCARRQRRFLMCTRCVQMCTRKNGAAIKEFFDVSFTIYRTFSRELLNEILVSTIQAAIIL